MYSNVRGFACGAIVPCVLLLLLAAQSTKNSDSRTEPESRIDVVERGLTTLATQVDRLTHLHEALAAQVETVTDEMRKKTNDLSKELTRVKLGTVPIGGIVAWHRHVRGEAAPLPEVEGYVICNGGTVNDPESPINGAAIPNLNEKAYKDKGGPWITINPGGHFLRGNAVSGIMQDGSLLPIPAEVVGTAMFMGKPPKGVTPRDVDDIEFTGDGRSQYNQASEHGPPNVRPWGVRVRPVNMSVVWMMRVK